MAIDVVTTPKGFIVEAQEPLELKTVQADEAARLGISIATTYDGLTVYQVSDKTTWQFQGDPEVAGNWVQTILDGFSKGDFISVSSGTATDAGKPIVLDATGKIDETMLSASDLSLYFLLDGSRALTAGPDMNVNTKKIINLANGSGAQDAVTFSQLSLYVLTASGVAYDSDRLNNLPASHYLNYDNITIGTILDGNLPATYSGNAATATVATTAGSWTESITLELDGGASGLVGIQGGETSNVVMITTVNAGDVIGGAGAYNRNWAGIDGYYGTAVTVARGDHTHDTFITSIESDSWLLNSSYSYGLKINYSNGRSLINIKIRGYWSSGILMNAGQYLGSIPEAFRPVAQVVQFSSYIKTDSTTKDCLLRLSSSGSLTVGNYTEGGTCKDLNASITFHTY